MEKRKTKKVEVEGKSTNLCLQLIKRPATPDFFLIPATCRRGKGLIICLHSLVMKKNVDAPFREMRISEHYCSICLHRLNVP